MTGWECESPRSVVAIYRQSHHIGKEEENVSTLLIQVCMHACVYPVIHKLEIYLT